MEKIMGYAVLTLKRSDLERAGACEPWLKVFDEICVLRGAEKAPLARLKNGESVRKPSWLRVELTPLTQLWLARDGIAALNWLRQKGLMGPANLREADLSGADLSGANMSRADLSGASLYGENITRLIARADRMDGYQFMALELEGGGYKIKAGCRWFTLPEFRAHTDAEYPGTDKHRETNDILDFIEARARALGVTDAPAAISEEA